MTINIVLVHPEIPHNTGAAGRLCIGIGARLHLIRPLGFSLDSSSLRRSGMDYWEHVKLTVHSSWAAFLESEQPQQMLFASTRGDKDLFDCSFENDAYIIFGNETSGLPVDFYETYKDDLFRIPMPGEYARSINLANAVSIAAYEAYRQGIYSSH